MFAINVLLIILRDRISYHYINFIILFVVIMSGRKQRGRKVTGVGSVTKKYLCRSLLWSPNQSAPLWSCWLHIVMEPLAATGSFSNQNWYFVRDTKGGLLLCSGGVGGVI